MPNLITHTARRKATTKIMEFQNPTNGLWQDGVLLPGTADDFRAVLTGVAAGTYGPGTLRHRLKGSSPEVAGTNTNTVTVTDAPVVVTNPPPQLVFTVSPTTITKGESTTLTADATDADGIASVTFRDNGTVIATVTTAPYVFVYTPQTAGNRVLAATAIDGGNPFASVSVNKPLTVNAPAPAVTVPGAPQGVTATAGNNTVALAWQAPASTGGATITGYRLYRNGTFLTNAPGLSYADNAATNGSSYAYEVSAVNSAGEGPKSTVTPGVTPSAPAPATPPTYSTTLSDTKPNDDAFECTLTLAAAYSTLTFQFNAHPGGDPTAKTMSFYLNTDNAGTFDCPIGYVGDPFRADYAGHIYTGTIADGNVTLTLFS